jgi:hypothetical protein
VSTPMMKCGHSANAEHDGKPCCVICAGITEGWDIVDTNPPDLSSRKARCINYGKPTRHNECNFGGERDTICHCEQPSDPTHLPFFEYKPEREFDNFYCGCHSWD